MWEKSDKTSFFKNNNNMLYYNIWIYIINNWETHKLDCFLASHFIPHIVDIMPAQSIISIRPLHHSWLSAEFLKHWVLSDETERGALPLVTSKEMKI